MNVPFGDLRRELAQTGDEIKAAIDDVLASGHFVLGDRVAAFEREFAEYLGPGTFVVGVGSGTEALHLSLVAAGVSPGDHVLTVPNTAVPTASAISAAGAIPLLVDVDEQTLTMDPQCLRDTVVREKARLGSKLSAVIPVHLYGQSADMAPILEIAEEYGLAVIEDACQAHGATYRGKHCGTLADFGAFSFYPSKNLGCLGDGGAIAVRTAEAAENLRMLRNYGQRIRYHHEIKGFNTRLDELQAAILSAKLPHLPEWNLRRAELAASYDRLITADSVRKPHAADYGTPAWHLYVVRHESRDRLITELAEHGIGALIHYPIPIHLQAAYADLGLGPGSFPVAERVSSQILSLPIFPQLTDDEIAFVARTLDKIA